MNCSANSVSSLQVSPRSRTRACRSSTLAPPWQRGVWSPAAAVFSPSPPSGRPLRAPCMLPIRAWPPSASPAPCTAVTLATEPSRTWSKAGVCNSWDTFLFDACLPFVNWNKGQRSLFVLGGFQFFTPYFWANVQSCFNTLPSGVLSIKQYIQFYYS